jgi:hypothetical protein
MRDLELIDRAYVSSAVVRVVPLTTAVTIESIVRRQPWILSTSDIYLGVDLCVCIVM